MLLEQRIECFAELGRRMLESGFLSESKMREAISKNAWFTEDSIKESINSIATEYLDKQKLSDWCLNYEFKDNGHKSVALILAGNIPLVGFHDILSVLISSHNVQIKMSERDSVLVNLILDTLIDIDDRFSERIKIVDRIKDFDAVIATGSDTTAAYFHKYFGQVDNIIRSNRHGIAVIRKSDDTDKLRDLSKDVFQYFGLGCRNVSKLYVEEGFELNTFFEAIEHNKDVIHHNKYKNNFDYNHAGFLLNKEAFLTNDFLLVREDSAISSRIASLHYEYYNSEADLVKELSNRSEEIQCIVSSSDIEGLDTFRFGHAQSPGLMDYADQVDTLEFLLNI